MRLLQGWLFSLAAAATPPVTADEEADPVYEVRPIGWIRKAEGRTTIEVERRYHPPSWASPSWRLFGCYTGLTATTPPKGVRSCRCTPTQIPNIRYVACSQPTPQCVPT